MIKINKKNLLTMFITILMIFSSIGMNVLGVSYNVTEDFVNGWTNHGDVWGTGTILKINEEVAFCLQAKVPAHMGPNNIVSPSEIGLSTNQINELALIVWYGYRSQPSTTNYFLTNNLIWDYLGDGNCYVSNSVYPTKASMQSWFDSVMSKVNHFHDMPSFNEKTYEVNVNETLEIVDTKGVLNGLSINNVTGATVTKDGNTLKITPNADCPDTISIRFNRGMSMAQTKTNFVVRNGNSQAISPCLSGRDPYKALVNIKVNKFGSVEIGKQDNKGNYVPDTSFKLSYSADMSNALGTYTTGANGKVIVNELLPQTVYIQETSVPSHLVLDSTVKNVTIEANKTASFTATNNWKQGYIEVTKKDKKTGQTVKKAGTEFEVLSGSHVVATISTNSNGIAKSDLLDYGSYTIREKKNPQNYILAIIGANTSITENNKTYSVDIFNEPVLGKIDLTKHDKETGENAQGDATLENAEYVLKANEPILNPSDNSVIYAKDETVSVKNIGTGTWGDVGTKKVKNGKINWSNLPMGIYRIEEIKTSEGYLKDNHHIVSLTSTSSSQSIETRNVTSLEQVIKGQLRVAKSGNDGSAGVVQGLANVEFTMKLYSEVQEVGWDNAKTYSTIITDQKGEGISSKVPYGIYLVKETKTPDNYMAGGDFFVNIDEDGEVEYRMVNNAPFKSWLKIIKTDEQGNSVTLTNTTFKLKDKDGNYVKQKVGLFYKDEWKTNDKGYAVLDDMLLSGEYTITELKNPNGFLIGEDINVNITSNSQDIIFDEDNEPVIIVTFVDKKPTGKIILNKSFEDLEDSAVGGAIFRLTANSDVIDPANGNIIYNKGDKVNLDIAEDGLYSVNESGKLVISGLPLGTQGASYQLEEIKTVDGYVLLEEPVIFDFEMKDNTTKEYVVEKNALNKLTETYFSKIDVGGKEVEGATLQIIDKESGKVVEEWVSTNETHIVEGLVIGKEYILHEDLAPLGYTLAQDVEFTLGANEQSITMVDTVVDVYKTDCDGNSVVGAKLQIVDMKTKNIVDQWVSDESKYIVKGLIVGHSYRIEEIETPKGYVTANPIEFKVDGTQNQSFVMIDKKVSFSKVDVGGKEVEGAKLQVIDKETSEIVDEWVSTKIVHDIDNLVVGKEYILHEDLAPLGYTLAQDIEFMVDNQDNQFIKMIDTIVDIRKVDENGKSVIGAKLQVVDIKTKNIVDQWVSDESIHVVKELIVGHSYRIEEIETPKGYITAHPIEFKVDGTQNQSYSMSDQRIITDIELLKIDSHTKELIQNNPAEFTLYSDVNCHDVIQILQTDEKGKLFIDDVTYGSVLYLKETKAPNGYELSNELIKIVIDDNLQGLGKIYQLSFENMKIPVVIDTSDYISSLCIAGLMCVGVISMCVFVKLRKKKDKQDKV